MVTQTLERDLEARVKRLERCLDQTLDHLGLVVLDAGDRPPRKPSPSSETSLRAPATVPDTVPVLPPSQTAAPDPEPSLGRATVSLGDRLGGQWLAWIGGAATLLGIVLFLALAVSHGWIGREARVVMAALASAGLVGAGAWLHGRRGRTEAAIAMTGAGAAGLFADLIVASEVYRLISAPLAIAACLAVGGLATVLAIRWAGQAVAALGIVGALLSPLLCGARIDAASLAVLVVATACGLVVVVWRRWSWLALATMLVGTPQWAHWLGTGHPALIDLSVLALFAGLGLAAATATQSRSPVARPQPAALVLLVLTACLTAAIGRVHLARDGGATIAGLWLFGLAAAHLGLGLGARGRLAGQRRFRQALIATGVVLADVSIGVTMHGLALAVAWAAGGLAFAALSRRHRLDETDRTLLDLGVGAHVGLVLVRTVIAVPVTELGSATAGLPQLLTLATLAATCVACGRLTTTGRTSWAAALDVLGLGAIAGLTAGALDGPSLVAAWSLEAVSLAQLHRRGGGPVAEFGAQAFLAMAGLHAAIVEAPPDALVRGVPDLGHAALALGVIAAALGRCAMLRPGASRARPALLAASAATLLYLASAAIITTFQPSLAEPGIGVLALSVRQQGQVLVSGLWSVTGLGVLVVGLRIRTPALRTAGLALLLLSVGKVFVYDLSALTSIYRVISVVVLGVLLLAGAFAHQRLRPPAPPDLRSLYPSQR